jgi:predicted ABC-class ATPase
MRSLDDLGHTLLDLDGRGYKAYKAIAGSYAAERFAFHVDHVQGDPFAEPSRLRVVVTPEVAALPGWARDDAGRRRSAADFLNRTLERELRRLSASRGSGKSGTLRMLRPGQQVLERSACTVGDDGAIEARFRVGLPAGGRRILGHEACTLLTEVVPGAVERGLLCRDEVAMRAHLETVTDAQALRAQLEQQQLVAFVANGARLPRRSGVDPRPLTGDNVVTFASPPALEVTLTAPHAGPVTGMGVPTGVTLIVGGGFHGKSTLLDAILHGVYDHVPGDGREQVVTVPSAVKVRAEDGRRVAGTDIANFIGVLPDGQDTTRFVTDDASGSTSQAAAIVEALEVGARCLLLDEDTSATNFMIRDARMQRLIAREQEPITPFIDRARDLADGMGVSTVLVVGGAGDYFDVADTVIAMDAYRARDVSARARAIAAELPAARAAETAAWQPLATRLPRSGCVDPGRGRKSTSIKTWAEDRVLYGTQEVDLSAVEQIVELAQTRAMAEALAWAHGHAVNGERDLVAVLDRIMVAIHKGGLDAVQSRPTGDLAEFRVFELAAFLNRLRSFDVR